MHVIFAYSNIPFIQYVMQSIIVNVIINISIQVGKFHYINMLCIIINSEAVAVVQLVELAAL